jgi:hypothetical protein
MILFYFDKLILQAFWPPKFLVCPTIIMASPLTKFQFTKYPSLMLFILVIGPLFTLIIFFLLGLVFPLSSS